MKVQSDTQQSLVEKLQGGLLINFNIATKSKIDNGKTVNYFEAEQVKVSATPNKAEVIEAILLDKYPTSEQLALIFNKDRDAEHLAEYTSYQEYRVFAKKIANSVMEIIK